MSKRYDSQMKTTAMHLLQANEGNITRTSHQTGIPARTLRDWRRQWREDRPQLPPPLNLQLERQDYPNQPPTEEHFDMLRTQLFDNILAIAANLSLQDGDSTIAQRSAALSHLIDQLMKLDKAKPNRDHVIQFEYVNKYGEVIPAPDWTRGDTIR